MAKNKTISSVILWSVISAAFIGPGTVTTAASAGSMFQLDLLWAVVFATVGCIILQEVSGRLTIASGLTMGQAMEIKYGQQKSRWLKFILGGPVVLGCAAYEAGNILGGVSGLNLITSVDTRLLTVGLSVIAAIVLWTGKKDAIGWLMTLLVAMMGIAFFALALGRPFSFSDYLTASTVPSLPPGAELLTLAVVGTTIVPYNVFLGSGISRGQTVPLMRMGLTVSVVIGGLITAAILVAGTAVDSFSNFNELAVALSQNVGPMAGAALGIGLFAAGFSSAITSPYAASIIASTVFNWGKRGQTLTWIFVLLAGFAFGISDIKPIPVILAVQALNGLVLPLLTAYLILLINDTVIIPKEHRQSKVYNAVLILIFGAVLLMGLNNVDKSVSTWLGIPSGHFAVMVGMTVSLMAYLTYKLFRSRIGVKLTG
jgi:manganese transport protein